jgi:hypothetical protein
MCVSPDVVCVSSGCYICCNDYTLYRKYMFPMFYLFYMYVASVLFVYCICFSCYMHMLQAPIQNISYVSDI